MNSAIEKIINSLKDNYKPQMIILFGSYANGLHTSGSDVDLLLVKDTDKRPIWRRVDAQLAVKTDLPLDILVYTPDEFDAFIRDKTSFLYQIYSTGKILFDARGKQQSEN